MLLTFVIGVLFILAPARGQTFYGSIIGTVTDSSGATIGSSKVTVTNNGTGERRTEETSGDGTYRFVNLVPGNYKLEIEQAGFKHYMRDQISVEVEAAVRVDVAMELGDISQQIEVTAAPPLLQTENASLSQVVGTRSVQELPLNGRNVLNLVNLVPGIVPQGLSDGNPTGKNMFAAGNYQIGGGTANQSASYYDGVPVNITYGNLVALVPTQDAVQEFRVQTNNNTAEYGRYTGGVVNIASRAGTNEFHGTTYEFLRNRVLNAGTFFRNKNGQQKASFTQNQFGANLGGPVKKDKLFFFGSYEGYRSRQGVLFNYTVPTEAQKTGDFSGYVNNGGQRIVVYDPLTQCGAYGNAACGSSTVQRSPFPGNIIPANRFNPVAANYLKFPYWGRANIPGTQSGNLFNYANTVPTGGNTNQLNFRGDYQASEKQRIFARFTRLQSANQQVNVYGNGLYATDPYAPEFYVTDQAVLADTYLLNATTVLDVRVGFTRWDYQRIPGTLGIDIAAVTGLPSYFDQIPALNGVSTTRVLPSMAISSPTINSIGTGRLVGHDDTYALTPTLSLNRGSHSLKIGVEVHKNELNYYQNNNPGGQFAFDNLFTSQNASNPGSTGSGFASFLLGLPSTGSSTQVQASPFTFTTLYYQGYFISDTWQATNKLTVTAGLRYEIPGVYTKRYGRQATFNATEINPVLQGIRVNGQPVAGAFDLTGTPNHPDGGLNPEHYTLFAPRLGVAYRLDNKTVIRTGAGIFYIPANVNFIQGPYSNAVNFFNNSMISTLDKNVTIANTLTNPFPNGLSATPGRNPIYQQLLLGASMGGHAMTYQENYGRTYQWNFTVQRQLPLDVALELAYAGLRGIHLPQGGLQYNQLNPQYFSLGSQLNTLVTNPFFGLIPTGPLSASTVQEGQLLSPFPQYQSVSNPGGYVGDSTYHALQVKAEKRFKSGGTILASYTFSKVLSNVESLTTWLESSLGGVAAVQNFYNLQAEKSLSSFDSRNRLVLSYVYDLPVGKGKRFLGGVQGVLDRFASGWGINGVTTFQDGFPLNITATPNLTGFNTGFRPNVSASCNKNINLSSQARINEWFNTACYSVPGAFAFGDQSRTDPNLRSAGIANYDFALFKRTAITERFNLEFRAESFNLFNRVQFGPPNTQITTAATSTFGVVTTQVNQPRLIQLALRLRY